MTLELTEREVAILAMALRGLLDDTARRAPCGPQHLTAEALEQRLQSLLVQSLGRSPKKAVQP
jgi:hypothetical protein